MAVPPPTRRKWLLMGGGFLLGLLAAGALLFVPAVQAWLLRRAVASQAGWKVDFARFAAGAGGVESEGLVFSMPGIEARAEPLAIRLSPFAMLRRRELLIEEVAARQLRLTITPTALAAAPAAESAPPFAGLLPLLRAPLAWSLQRTALDGRLAVADAGREVAAGEFSVHGGGVAANQPGEFSYDLTADSALLPSGPNAKLRSRGKLRIEQDRANGIGRMHLAGSLSLPAYGGLTLPAGHYDLTVEPSAKGERYTGTLRLGDAEFVLAAELDPVANRIAGTLRFKGDQELIRSLLGDETPTLAANGEIRFETRLDRGDTDVAVTAEWSGRDWQKYMPELSAVDALGGNLTARLERRDGGLHLTALAFTAKGRNSPAALQADLLESVPLPDWPERPQLRLTAARWPVAWADPFAKDAGLTFSGAEFEGAWLVAFSPDAAWLRLRPERPATVQGLLVKGAGLPAVPPLSLAFSPQVTVRVNDADVIVRLDDFVLTAPGGDRLAGAMEIGLPADLTTVLRGGLQGRIPTLLTGAERPLPFALAARWDATLSTDGNTLTARALSVRLSEDESARAVFALEQVQPAEWELTKLTAKAASPDVLTVQVDQLGLGWLTRWLPPGWQVDGRLAGGAGRLRHEADGRLTFATRAPWTLEEFSLGLGGKEVFRGRTALEIEATIAEQNVVAQVSSLMLADERGNRVTGTAAATIGRKDSALGGELHLKADLPALPHSEGAFGALTASLDLKAGRFQGNLFMAEQAEFTVRHVGGELLRLESPEPFLLGFNDRGVYATATITPLKMRTGEMPLAWLRPWLPAGEVTGVVEPAEFLFEAKIQNYHLRPTRPLRVRGLSLGPAAAPLVRDAALGLYPGLDAEFHLVLLPTFALAHSVRLHGSDGAVDLGGRRVADLDFALGILGNDQTVLPKTIDLTLRTDFGELAALPGYARYGLPARGRLTLRANGDMLGAEPLELWARLEGVPAAAGDRALAPLELTAHGKVHGSQTPVSADFDVDLRLDDPKQPTDAAFHVTFKPGQTLDLASAFRSRHLDLGELLAWQAVFTAPPVATAVPAPAGVAAAPSSVRPAARAGAPPFWSTLRGYFDLELGVVDFAPYRIEDVRGRLELGADELALRNLAGRMFAGRWGGEVKIRHEPKATDGHHVLQADFAIEQFESARVVQTVFSEDFPADYAKVDAKFDVRAGFASRGDVLLELIDRASGGFTATSRGGTVRLTLPKQEMASSLAILGGTVALSPELRALGRLLRKFSEMPVEELSVRGARGGNGEVRLDEFRLVSPQARLTGRGRIAPDAATPLMNRPLDAAFELAARDETAVILGRMGLLENKPDATGYQPMREKFTVGGKAGEPDTRALYDLLARAVAGSKGTWGFLMRRVQAEVEKTKPKTAPGGATGQ